jgi:hypothetical protein
MCSIHLEMITSQPKRNIAGLRFLSGSYSSCHSHSTTATLRLKAARHHPTQGFITGPHSNNMSRSSRPCKPCRRALPLSCALASAALHTSVNREICRQHRAGNINVTLPRSTQDFCMLWHTGGRATAVMHKFKRHTIMAETSLSSCCNPCSAKTCRSRRVNTASGSADERLWRWTAGLVCMLASAVHPLVDHRSQAWTPLSAHPACSTNMCRGTMPPSEPIKPKPLPLLLLSSTEPSGSTASAAVSSGKGPACCRMLEPCRKVAWCE